VVSTARWPCRVGALLAWCMLVPIAHAQGPVQASVDRPVVRDNESFTLVLRAEGAVRGEPEDAPLASQFDVLNRSSSRRVGIVNGRTSEVSEWQYQLMPKAAGDFTIPSLRVGDRQTNAVSVRVLAPEPTAGPAAADIFMELAAEPQAIYAQSQILFTLRLFIGVSTGRATLTAPETTGVETIVEKLGEDAQYQATRGGRSFIVRERRYAVFPQAAGMLTIGPVTFEAMVIPDRGFSRVQRFRSDVLSLEVLPAVPPPASLAGAAWLPAQRVTLTEQWSGSGEELTVGIPSTRTIVVEGLGLLETQLPEVSVEAQAGIRQYADQPELNREITATGLASRRSMSFAVIAQSEGELVLNGVRLPWWNVVEQRWEVAELPPRALRVAPSGERDLEEPPVAEPQAVPAVTPPAASGSPWPLLSAILALAWLATMALWWRSRSARDALPAPLRVTAPAEQAALRRPTLRKILRDLDSACVVADPAAARHALLAFAETRFTESPPRSLGALAAVLPESVGREVLALEAHIYGVGGGEWRGDALRAVLGELETSLGGEGVGPADPLAPLYR
jgi:hypothetical protein